MLGKLTLFNFSLLLLVCEEAREISERRLLDIAKKL
jgi:hypothetical protein